MSDEPMTAVTEAGGADINGWNDRVIAEFRANGGWVHWSSDEELAAGRPVPPPLPGFDERGLRLILVHHIGAKSGRERINPLFFQEVDGGWAVFATYGGSPRHPVWYHNLMANPRTVVEVGTERVPVVARLAEGEERERIWSRQVALVPKFAEFEAAAGRQIPVVVLERAEGSRTA